MHCIYQLKIFLQFTFLLVVLASGISNGQQNAIPPLLLDGFSLWRTGHDDVTEQLLPLKVDNGLTQENNTTVAHVKFIVKEYGELSFPIDPNTSLGEEARKVDLSKSRFVSITYRANHEVVLQLRQTGVHGGVQNHVILPASIKFVTRKVYFADFKGGRQPLDLTNVAKFNFAFLSNNARDGYAELVVKHFQIDQYHPQ